jgi:hypothetical protein
VYLEPSLLDTPVENIESPSDLKACLNAHGLYNSFQFVLRLSPEVHRKIDALPKGIITGTPVRRQLFLWVDDNYFSRSTTTTL